MITIRYWELALIFLAGIGFWHLAMGVVYPHYGAMLEAYISRQKAKIAEYDAMCASQPPPIGVDEPTVHIGQVVSVPQQREPEPELPIDLRPSQSVHYGEAPIFNSIPLSLPFLPPDFAAYGSPSWSVATGGFPVVPTPARELEEAMA